MPTDKNEPPLVEGIDYAVENGRWVFSAAFLRRRGECCDSNCRNCPYRSEADKKPGGSADSGRRDSNPHEK